MNLAQIVAVIIFLAMFALIISGKVERQKVTLVAGLIMVVVVMGLILHDWKAIWDVFALGNFAKLSFWYTAAEGETSSVGINWATIIFIAGMMLMVEGMSDAGFFRWLCLSIAKLVDYKVTRLLMAFMIMSAVLSMFIDSITVILFLAAVTIELAKLLEFDPVSMIIAEVFCANLGGSSTMCGDPPNIIVGTALGYTFGDFLTNTGLVALVALVFSLLYFHFATKKEYSKNTIEGKEINYPNAREAITNKTHFIQSCVIFGCAIVLLVTHAQTGLTVATIGVFIAILTIICGGTRSKDMLKRVDYKTLLFFIGLFVVVGGLETTGILEVIASFIDKLSGGSLWISVLVILIISAVASAIIDNIPFAATMIPVIKSLSMMPGMDLPVLAWALSIGTDIGGSATPIGASANVVGISVAEKNGYKIGWGKYCKLAIPATVMVIVIAALVMRVRYF